jgi:hypothetical protein
VKQALAILSIVLVAAGCKAIGASSVKCDSFEGKADGAVWSKCTDKVKREIACSPSLGVRNQTVAPKLGSSDLVCECFEDGAKKGFFFAKDPPLATLEDAKRVAKANCRWSLD